MNNNETLNSLFVTDYNICCKLRDIGFNEECLATFIELKNPSEGIFGINNDGTLLSPTWDQIFTWFDNKYKLNSFFTIDIDGKWYFKILNYADYINIDTNTIKVSGFDNPLITKTELLKKLIKFCS